MIVTSAEHVALQLAVREESLPIWCRQRNVLLEAGVEIRMVAEDGQKAMAFL